MKRLFESAADFVDKEIQIEYLVEGVIEKDTIGVMFGETGVIDTLARHMDGDENSAKDMGNLVSGISRLQSVFPGSVVLLVHHTGNNNKDRSRGSSALKAAMDFEICVKRGNISFTKMKDAEAPGNLSFKLLPVEISSGLSDETSASCVVEYKEFSSSGNRRKLSDTSQLGLKALSAVCATKQQNTDDSYTVQVDDWREQFYSLRNEAEPEAKQGALKKSFQRVRDDLLEQGHIYINGDEVVWYNGISGTRDKSET